MAKNDPRFTQIACRMEAPEHMAVADSSPVAADGGSVAKSIGTNKMLIPFVVVAVVECCMVFALCRLPDKGHWKIVLASLLLAVAIGAAFYFPFASAYEKTYAQSIHAEACHKAEELIRAGKKVQLQTALHKDWWNDCAGMTQIETAEAFLNRVNTAEEVKP